MLRVNQVFSPNTRGVENRDANKVESLLASNRVVVLSAILGHIPVLKNTKSLFREST